MVEKISILSFVLIILSAFSLLAPIPDDDPPLSEADQSPNRLFYIARSKNANVVCYDANFNKNGELDQNNPIKVYWINRTDNPGHQDGLSYVQRQFAYGYDFDKQSDGSYIITLVAFKERKLTLKQTGKNKGICSLLINKKPAILKKIFIQTEPDSFRKVQYAELEGISADDGKIVKERVHPK